jgi:hypothetical protein
MGPYASLVWAVLLAVDPRAAQAPADTSSVEAGTDTADIAEEPAGGAGVSPLEIVPRLELRQSFQKLAGGAHLNDTTAEMDIQFARRILLRYQAPFRVLSTPGGQVSGIGDLQFGALGIIYSDPTRLLAVILGSVLNTASQPPLGAGKQQIVFGGGGAVKPYRWLLTYGEIQEQISVGGDRARPSVNELMVDLGAIGFGKQYNWLKADLLPTVDFPGGAMARLFGVLEAGSLLVGRVGLFVRAGTQFLGSAQLDYSIAGGIRYLFRLEKGRSREPEPMQ